MAAFKEAEGVVQVASFTNEAIIWTLQDMCDVATASIFMVREDFHNYKFPLI